MPGTNEFLLTNEGKEQYEKEYRRLLDVERPEVIEQLQAARAMGDLSENADYDAAREEQRRIEGRIAEIEGILKNYVLISSDATDIVSIGKKVRILYTKLNKEFTYDVVGTIEADPFNGKISNTSPLGKAIIGKRKDEVINFTTESGKHQEVKILEILQ